MNTPSFETLWQKFRVPAKWISLETRRRDGSSLSGGYEHGELKFTIPVQNRYASEVDADQALLDALTLADAKKFPVLQRLETALPAFALANTDSATLTRQQELVWMAAAFETFLDSGSQCNHLVKKFSDQWKHYGTVKISETLSSTNRFAGLKHNDANTFIHSVWIRELCVLRGMTIHSSPLHKRQNIWDDFQHLLMGSFAFPLLVKVLLSQESLYLMTPEDAGSARAVDKLLCLSDWGQDPKLHHSSEQSIWQDTINDEILAHIIEQGTQELLKGLNDNQGGSS